MPHTVLPTPEDVVVSMCEEASSSKVLRTRYASRVLPIVRSCYASVEAMKALAPQVVKPHFPDGEGEAGAGIGSAARVCRVSCASACASVPAS